MTAVLGILNKNSIALATDSAVTISGMGQPTKIFNRANKLFALSKFNPVGIMLYNSPNLMNTPWEIIIKIYRKQLKNKSFNTLIEYQEDFIEFLRKKNFFLSNDDEGIFLKFFCINTLDVINKNVIDLNNLNLNGPVSEENKKFFFDKLNIYIDESIEDFDDSNICEEIKEVGNEEFNKKIDPFFDEVINTNYSTHGYEVPPPILEKLKIVLLNYFKTKSFINFTGLVFSGFGEEEIYPQLIALNISMSFNGRLRYYIDSDNCSSISSANPTAICAFAQTDVIDTILSGIDPFLDNIYNTNFKLAFERYNGLIIEKFGETNPELIEVIKALNYEQLTKDLIIQNDRAKQINYIKPLANAINSLSKEDLAEMSESLIYLTYLKRRFTFAEESVGGPVDVAVISKGDGFIWIKRKHYFKPELNQQFLNNYFNI